MQLISVVAVLLLVPRLRREFARPGLYSLFAMFLICMIPPIIWNAQHTWATLGHLRTRGALDRAPGIHLLELLSFLAMHLAVYSPLLWLGLAWAVIASWRRAHQQFKGIYLLWLGLPVFGIYFILSFNHAANANWDGLAFLSLGVLAASYWRERLASRPKMARWAGAAYVLGLIMSLLALNSDLSRVAGFQFRSDPTDRMRCWQSSSAALERVRAQVEADLGQPVFLIADERARASEFAFYFRDKRVEGPGHPPVYIVESQDVTNQFSFWPRYDEFVDAPPNAPRPEGDVYTEENGVNPFTGRTGALHPGERESQCAEECAGRISIDRAVPHDRGAPLWPSSAHPYALYLQELPHPAAMTHSPAVSVVVPLFNEEENVPILQAELFCRKRWRATERRFIRRITLLVA